jgi:protein-S-isoprenylcysteine O-methyltransferase Ste14
MAVLILGFGVLARNGWHLVGLALFLVVIDRTQVPREERYLEGRFGEEFRDYKRRVRRWV